MSTKVFFFLLTLFFLLPSMGDAKNSPSGAKQTKETILSTKDSTTHQYARLNPLLPLSQKISQSTWKGIRGALWTVWSVCGLTLLSLIMVLLIVKKGWFNRLSMTIWWLILIGWEFALLLYAALDDPQYSCVHAFATFSFSWDKILYFFVLLISTLFVLAAFYFSTATFKEMLELKMPLLYLSPLILIGLIFITFIVLSFVVNNEQLRHIQPILEQGSGILYGLAILVQTVLVIVQTYKHPLLCCLMIVYVPLTMIVLIYLTSLIFTMGFILLICAFAVLFLLTPLVSNMSGLHRAQKKSIIRTNAKGERWVEYVPVNWNTTGWGA